jgi:hypothetical protein
MFNLSRYLLFVFSICWLFACEDANTGPAPLPDQTFTDSQRASCPESPFKPEYPVVPKRGAAQQTIHIYGEVYTTQGKFVTIWDAYVDPNAPTGGTQRPRFAWDGRDYRGNEAPSGYYFVIVTMTDTASGQKQTQRQCFFWINPADQDKVQ